MEKITLVLIILFLIISPVFAGETKVYTDADLENYKNGQEEETRQYNQKALQNTQKDSDYYNTQSKNREALDKYQRVIVEEDKVKRDAALEKIRKLEQEGVQEGIDARHELKVGGFVGKRRAEERAERASKRKQELDASI